LTNSSTNIFVLSTGILAPALDGCPPPSSPWMAVKSSTNRPRLVPLEHIPRIRVMGEEAEDIAEKVILIDRNKSHQPFGAVLRHTRIPQPNVLTRSGKFP